MSQELDNEQQLITDEHLRHKDYQPSTELVQINTCLADASTAIATGDDNFDHKETISAMKEQLNNAASTIADMTNELTLFTNFSSTLTSKNTNKSKQKVPKLTNNDFVRLAILNNCLLQHNDYDADRGIDDPLTPADVIKLAAKLTNNEIINIAFRQTPSQASKKKSLSKAQAKRLCRLVSYPNQGNLHDVNDVVVRQLNEAIDINQTKERLEQASSTKTLTNDTAKEMIVELLSTCSPTFALKYAITQFFQLLASDQLGKLSSQAITIFGLLNRNGFGSKGSIGADEIMEILCEITSDLCAQGLINTDISQLKKLNVIATRPEIGSGQGAYTLSLMKAALQYGMTKKEINQEDDIEKIKQASSALEDQLDNVDEELNKQISTILFYADNPADKDPEITKLQTYFTKIFTPELEKYQNTKSRGRKQSCEFILSIINTTTEHYDSTKNTKHMLDLLLLLKSYLTAIQAQATNKKPKSKPIAKQKEKQRKKKFVRNLLTQLIVYFDVRQAGELPTDKETQSPMIAKQEIPYFLPIIVKKLDSLIDRFSVNYHQHRRDDYDHITRFLAVMVTKEYEIAHHDDKAEIGFNLILAFWQLPNTNNHLSVLTQLDSAIETSDDIGGTQKK